MNLDPELVKAAEQKAKDDYDRACGTVVEVPWLYGYIKNDSVDLPCGDTPFKVRVLKTQECDLRHWVDENLDPYWDVEPLPHPSIPEGFSSPWVFGPSYRIDAGAVLGPFPEN